MSLLLSFMALSLTGFGYGGDFPSFISLHRDLATSWTLKRIFPWNHQGDLHWSGEMRVFNNLLDFPLCAFNVLLWSNLVTQFPRKSVSARNPEFIWIFHEYSCLLFASLHFSFILFLLMPLSLSSLLTLVHCNWPSSRTQARDLLLFSLLLTD